MMSAEPIQLRVLADFAHEAMRVGLLSAAKIVGWADELIEASATPDSWLIDLAMANVGDPLAVRAALRQVPGPSAPSDSRGLVLGLLFKRWRAGVLSIGDVRWTGWTLCRNEYGYLDSTSWAFIIDHHGDELEEGYISEDEMRLIIDSYLSEFELYSHRLPTWVL